MNITDTDLLRTFLEDSLQNLTLDYCEITGFTGPSIDPTKIDFSKYKLVSWKIVPTNNLLHLEIERILEIEKTPMQEGDHQDMLHTATLILDLDYLYVASNRQAIFLDTGLHSFCYVDVQFSEPVRYAPHLKNRRTAKRVRVNKNYEDINATDFAYLKEGLEVVEKWTLWRG